MFWLFDTIIVTPIVNILFIIHNFIGDFGLAIIIFTVIVKILTWPLMKKQLKNAKLMKQLQPELAEIKKNCKGNRQLESLQMLDLYKRYNVRPFRSILTTLIQIPIFIALFTAVGVMTTPKPNDNVEKRAYPFLSEHLPGIKTIIEKQQVFLADSSKGYDFHPRLFGVVNLDARPGLKDANTIILLIFCFASAYMQYLIVKQTSASSKKRSFRQIMKDASAGKEPSPAEINGIAMRQMSYMMPIMMFLFMASLPGAIVFYYTLHNVTHLIQQKIIFDQSGSEMEISADKAVLKELKNIKEATVIAKDSKSNTKTNITRISANTSRPKRRK